MPLDHAHLFASAPDWAAWKAKNPTACRRNPMPPLDVPAARAAELVEEGEWATAHVPESYGYSKRTVPIAVQDGPAVPAAIYTPLQPPSNPGSVSILFVTHGGGFVQGTPVTEECWLFALLLARLGTRFVVVNVDYRLAPEHPYPIPEEDCWRALQTVAVLNGAIVDPELFSGKIIIAGSSAGGGLAAALAQRARDWGLKSVVGAVLNVPVLCHPDVFPVEVEQSSYQQCSDDSEAQLTGAHMREIWEAYVPGGMASGKERASPLLKDTKGLQPHAIFVAGQDPLRDEGLAYAEKLRRDGVDVELRIYPGVPHSFAKRWELESTQKFQQHLAGCVERMLTLAC